MTHAQLVDVVTKKIGQFDAASVSACGTFVNRRYQTIYDSRNWLDAMFDENVDWTGGTSVYDLPDTLERIKSVFLTDSGQTVDPIDFQVLSDIHPEFVNGSVTGTPKFYLEFENVGTKRYQVYPAPDKDYTAHLNGKKAFTELTANDAPILRNIDNCLIAYAYYDMLQRMRQFGKATVIKAEADAALAAAVAIETQLSNMPRQARNLTVSGDSLAELTDAVATRVKDYTPPTRIIIQECLRRNYLELYASQLWPESTVIFSCERDGSEVVLPEYVDYVQAVRQTPTFGQLVPRELTQYFSITPGVFEQTGTPVSFSVLTSVGVAVLPPLTEPLQFTSSDNFDISPVFVMGETGGVEAAESVTLNGQAVVPTTLPYDTPITVSKGITNGYVDVKGFVSQQFLVRLLPNERERKHVRIWMQPAPVSDDTNRCLILGKRRIHPFVQDEDTPIVKGIGNALIAMAVADIMDMNGNADMAQSSRQKAAASVQTILDRETKQSAYEPVIVPYAEALPCI